MDVELLVRLQPVEVREAGAVGQAVARRDGAPARILGQSAIVGIEVGEALVIERRQVGQGGRDRAVEIDQAVIDHLHDRIGEDRLGQGGAVHDGVGRQGIAGLVALAVGFHMGDLAAVDDRHGDAAGTRLLHEASDGGVDFGTGGGPMGGLGRGGGRAEAEGGGEGGKQSGRHVGAP